MLLCCADLEAPCMFNTPCADLGLPFDQLLKKEETGMGTKLLLQNCTIHSAHLLTTESWAICNALPAFLVHQHLTIKVVSDCRDQLTDDHLLP